jgi:signal transduction histidine kinase
MLVIEDKPAHREQRHPSCSNDRSTAMATILVLDDRSDNRDFLVMLLGYVGHRLLEAADAKQALALVRAAQPDLVIADVLMPEIDGFEFVRRLRADSQIAHTRVIFYTAAYVEAEVRLLAESCGVAQVLIKPADPQVLLAAVQAVLGTPAPTRAVPSAEAFAAEHQRVLLGKLAQKIDELELLNADLETRVAVRTAELADANIRLRELHRFKDNMLAITSHDLRSPLGAIQNMAELMSEELDLPDEARRLTQMIYTTSRHLIGTVSQLLDLARLETGKVKLEQITLRVSDVARSTLDVLQVSAQAKTIATELIVEPEEPLISADWMKLAQVLTNLVSNAIKFTQPGGQVTVTVGPAPYGVCIRVADTGLGIPTDELPHLFEQFRQVHTRGTADERGSGLGLAIVRQLVELHSGMIEVTSMVTQGSTFTIHLPIGQLE